MEIRADIFIIIIGGMIVTLLPRVLPLLVLSRITLPEWGQRWLQFIPISIMAALITQSLFMANSLDLKVWIAALIALGVAGFTRSLLGTVVVGMFVIMCLRYFY
ncbi:AzlD domain-containing protein [Thermoflavimicrobium daqui]|uniref:Branched-chain amino acid ABC transporter n=1 Tax=Thermoflavimicrobium daqui TaxID=2137476 RepID=A0A364K414_9BACL|nr:AzlD domain-containing protein [Thermoflavimicrobium daqui]RAL24031.1 branched-chain amino acid ABC transporter [Thermoflavimicrobium daqui]